MRHSVGRVDRHHFGVGQAETGCGAGYLLKVAGLLRAEVASEKHAPAEEEAGIEQGVDVAVDRLGVATHAPRHLADRERAGTGHRAPDGEALRVQAAPVLSSG